ncbi:hypothetical protein NIB75_00225 [Bacteroides uniformis]|nr:hypothetical protein [Bacteroides uniformis]
MKKKLMTLQQHRLLKEAGQLIAFSERLKHVQKETTDRNREEREEKAPPERESRKRRDCTGQRHRGVPHFALRLSL